MLYLKGTYGIGPATELRFAPGAVSEASSAGPRGICPEHGIRA